MDQFPPAEILGRGHVPMPMLLPLTSATFEGTHPPQLTKYFYHLKKRQSGISGVFFRDVGMFPFFRNKEKQIGQTQRARACIVRWWGVVVES